MVYHDIFFIIYLVSAAITGFIALYVLRIGRNVGINIFSAMLISITVWSLTAAIGMGSPTEEVSKFYAVIRMVAVILTPLFWIIFALTFSNNKKRLRHRFSIIVFSISFVSVLMMVTNDFHHLFYKEIVIEFQDGYYLDACWIKGPYFWIHVIYSYFLVAGGIYFILRKALGLGLAFRRQAAVLIIGMLLPVIGNLALIFELTPDAHIQYDVLGFALGGLMISYAIWQLNLFDVTPIARRILVDNLLDGMVVVNHQNKIMDINPAAQKILELEYSDAIGCDICMYFSDQIQKLLNIYSEQTVKVEWHKESTDNLVDVFDLHISPIFSEQKHLGFLFALRDVTEQRILKNRLQELAITDALTGLFNHRHFYELFEKEVGRSLRMERALSLVMMDIDHFKKINDSYGHLCGDRILRELADICKDKLRTYDILARYGGEEFAIILPETDSKAAAALAERLRQDIEKHSFDTVEESLTLTVSMGVSTLLHDQPVTSEDLINCADMALYESKEKGRNKVTVYENKKSAQLKLI